MPRDTRAEQPSFGYARPPVLSFLLVLTPVSEDGEALGVWDFRTLPASRSVQAAFAEGFADRTDVGGSWPRTQTIMAGWRIVGHFLRWYAARGQQLHALAGLTPAVWDAYVLSLPTAYAAQLNVLKSLLIDSGQLQPETLRTVSARGKQYRPPVQASLTAEQARKVLRVAHGLLDAAQERVLESWALLADHHAGLLTAGTEQAEWGALLAYVEKHLDVPRRLRPGGGGTDVRPEVVRLLGTGKSIVALQRLFLTNLEAGAVMALLGLHEGWNPDMILDFSVNDIQRVDSGDEELRVYNIGLDKPRLGAWRYVANTLVETSPRTAAAVVRQTLETTAPARRLLRDRGMPVDDFLIYLRAGLNGPGMRLTTPRLAASATVWATVKRFSDHVGLRNEKEEPVRFHRKMLRRTSTTQIRPQAHSEDTNMNVYQLNDATVREESKSIVEDGLQAAIGHAEATVLKVPASEAPEASLAPATARAIDAGDLDTPVASCKDVLHSPLNDLQQCNVSFLMCLKCTNMVVVPRHLPRLVYLHQRLDALRRSLGDGPLWQRWLPTWLRLTDLLDRKFTDAERAAAAERITEQDRALIDNTLARRYDT